MSIKQQCSANSDIGKDELLGALYIYELDTMVTKLSCFL